ncbi:GATA zinc finger [Colletotrichum paranaense]|uniref:GATA zinc finger n=1 Tax=Colletotrichum paranaense TaxID=1914294 RepID=A0ABQ9T6R4_9PEZI|nr:GATA zinc finger [Colletotrichum paranaense]KAK1547472.1 GATA zinc finger [Colletotrichum paranaense]
MSHGPPQPPTNFLGFGPQDAYSAFEAVRSARFPNHAPPPDLTTHFLPLDRLAYLSSLSPFPASDPPDPPAHCFEKPPPLLQFATDRSQQRADAMQMAEADPNIMSSLLDSTVYGSFDAMSMSVDNPNDENAMSTFNFVGNTPMPDGLPDDTPSMNNNYSNNGDDTSSVVGGGPMPSSGFNSQALQQAGSTLTEFTKRRNWPAKVVEELKDFLQILDANGRIRFVSPSILNLTGYTADEILDTFLKELVHPDDQGVYVAELNESIASGNPLRLFFRLKKKDGKYAIFESVGHAHIAASKFAPNPHNQTPFCQAVFMMSRPYPTKNAGLLDSFLEHKIENERLRRRIAELRKEEDMENEESQRQWLQSQEGRSDVTPSETTMTSAPSAISRAGDGGDRSSALNVALTREALEGVAGSRPDSLKDKMARYEGNSHTDTIEMLTGLRYIEGERSRGITTGNASPTLIKGDAGIAIPQDRDPRTGDKKKKLKTSEEYVCTDCGTLDSPEWRKGPSGPKTLCNACGLRWAKKEKKNRHGNNNAHHSGSLQVEHGGG